MIEALKDLHDIHTPPPINLWWPPAPGILISVAIFLGLALYMAWRVYSRKARQIKKIALAQLSALEVAHHAGTSASQTAADISILLKQVALLFYPRVEVASLEGEAWLLFLSKSGQKLDFTAARQALLYLAYAPDEQAAQELPHLFSLTRRWIKQRSHRCLN